MWASVVELSSPVYIVNCTPCLGALLNIITAEAGSIAFEDAVWFLRQS